MVFSIDKTFALFTIATNYGICQVISCFMMRVSWIMLHYKEVHPLRKASISACCWFYLKSIELVRFKIMCFIFFTFPDICQVISCFMMRVSWIMSHYKEVHPLWKAAIRNRWNHKFKNSNYISGHTAFHAQVVYFALGIILIIHPNPNLDHLWERYHFSPFHFHSEHFGVFLTPRQMK